MKKIFLLSAAILSAGIINAQVIYSNSFNNLSLQTYTTPSTSTKFAAVPGTFALINDGLKNNVGSTTNPNRPFNEPGLKTTGWAVVYNAAENDTFLVSTSWLDTTTIAVDRWIITPPVTNISGSSVLTWMAKSPDPSYAEGYEVYGTTNTGVLTPQNFTIGDRLFVLADGNTSGSGEKSIWTRRSVNIGAFAGQTLRFAFRNNSKDMYQLWIDDIQVISLSANIDAALSTVSPKKYILANASDSVKINVSNKGAVAISTINLSYQVGSGSVDTEDFVINGNLSYGQSTELKFALPYSGLSATIYPLKIWINTVNGQNDQNAGDNSVTDFLTVQNSSPTKTILFEQFVSANNGEGPEQQGKTNALQSTTLVVVNIHDQDSMKENNSAALISDYKKNMPGALVDRLYYNDLQSNSISMQGYNARINARANAVTPVSVSVINKNYNPANRLLAFTLKADFAGSVMGDYRLNAYLTENYVSGVVTDTTINGYNQLNGYFGVSWSAYYQQGYYAPLADSYVLNYWQFQHKNVLVHAFDGAYGVNGAITSTVTQGQTFQQTFSLTVPTTTNGTHKFNADNLYIVGFAAEYSADKNHRNVLNAVKEKVTANAEVVGITQNTSNKIGLLIYPNPSAGNFYFNKGVSGTYGISVYDIFGKCVKSAEVSNSTTIQPLDLTELPTGVYIFKIQVGNGAIRGKGDYSKMIVLIFCQVLKK